MGAALIMTELRENNYERLVVDDGLCVALPALSNPAMFLFSAKKSAGDFDFSVSLFFGAMALAGAPIPAENRETVACHLAARTAWVGCIGLSMP